MHFRILGSVRSVFWIHRPHRCNHAIYLYDSSFVTESSNSMTRAFIFNVIAWESGPILYHNGALDYCAMFVRCWPKKPSCYRYVQYVLHCIYHYCINRQSIHQAMSSPTPNFLVTSTSSCGDYTILSALCIVSARTTICARKHPRDHLIVSQYFRQLLTYLPPLDLVVHISSHAAVGS